MTAWWLAGVFAVGPVFGPAAAPAPTQTVRVDATACERLDAARVQRLLNLEIAGVAEARQPARDFEVRVTCNEGPTTIAVVDPLTEKSVARDLATQASDADPERTVALAAIQLFVASWLELRAADPVAPLPAEEDEAEAALAIVDERAETSSATTPSTPPAAEPSRLGHEIGLGGGPTWRALQSSPVFLGRLDLRYLLWPHKRVGVELSVAGEYGNANRALGVVRVLDGGFGAGIHYRSRSFGPISFDAGIIGHAVAQDLRGRSERNTVDEGKAYGLGFEPRARVGLGVHSRFLRVALAVEGGWLVGGPVGAVTGGEDLSVQGGFLGTTLNVAWVRAKI